MMLSLTPLLLIVFFCGMLAVAFSWFVYQNVGPERWLRLSIMGLIIGIGVAFLLFSQAPTQPGPVVGPGESSGSPGGSTGEDSDSQPDGPNPYTNPTPPTPSPQQSISGPFEANVISIVDADSIIIDKRVSSTNKVQLAGIDALGTNPRFNNPTEWNVNETSAECLADWGENATFFLRQTLLNRTATFEFDGTAPKFIDTTDGGKVLYMHVMIDNTSVNEELIKRGYARLYAPGSFFEYTTFSEIEENSRQNGMGAWACGQ